MAVVNEGGGDDTPPTSRRTARSPRPRTCPPAAADSNRLSRTSRRPRRRPATSSPTPSTTRRPSARPRSSRTSHHGQRPPLQARLHQHQQGLRRGGTRGSRPGAEPATTATRSTAPRSPARAWPSRWASRSSRTRRPPRRSRSSTQPNLMALPGNGVPRLLPHRHLPYDGQLPGPLRLLHHRGPHQRRRVGPLRHPGPARRPRRLQLRLRPRPPARPGPVLRGRQGARVLTRRRARARRGGAHGQPHADSARRTGTRRTRPVPGGHVQARRTTR